MKISNRKVGFELEFFTRTDIMYKKFLWGETDEDGSLYSDDDNNFPVEFQSFPKHGEEIFPLIDGVYTDIIRKYRDRVNKTCGFHVHLDMNNKTPQQRLNIQRWWLVYEEAFFSLVPSWRQCSHWCRRIGSLERFNYSDPKDSALNTNTYYGTYEVRLHHGTVRKTEIKHWIHLLLLFFDRFENQECLIRHERKLSDLFRKIEAPQKLRRFFYKRAKLYAISRRTPAIARRSQRTYQYS